jgi:hypothetical protein
MPRATSFLTIAALAVVLDDRLAARFITDRAARTSAGVGLGHCQSPLASFLVGTQGIIPILAWRKRRCCFDVQRADQHLFGGAQWQVHKHFGQADQ